METKCATLQFSRAPIKIASYGFSFILTILPGSAKYFNPWQHSVDSKL